MGRKYSGVSFAPEFDGLNCFETIVWSRPTKQDSEAGNQASTSAASVPTNGECLPSARGVEYESSKNASSDGRSCLSFAPELDDLNCFETIISTRNSKKESAEKQARTSIASVPRKRELVIAPEFDGLHCFETLIWPWKPHA